jgi:hypothetical protein
LEKLKEYTYDPKSPDSEAFIFIRLQKINPDILRLGRSERESIMDIYSDADEYAVIKELKTRGFNASVVSTPDYTRKSDISLNALKIVVP